MSYYEEQLVAGARSLAHLVLGDDREAAYSLAQSIAQNAERHREASEARNRTKENYFTCLEQMKEIHRARRNKR